MKFPLAAALVLAVSACGTDTTEETILPTYTDLSTKVFVPVCATAACHAGDDPSFGGFSLKTPDGYAKLLLPVNSLDWPEKYKTWKRVDPGHPELSALMVQLEHHVDLDASARTKVLRMPQAGKLPAATIEVVRTWIANGAKND